MGQTPPPWHGQAVATQLLFDHDWPDFGVHRLRMEYSEEMLEVGRLQLKKVVHLFRLIGEARRILRAHPGCVLFYPPASAKWIPFLRDVVFLSAVRRYAGSTVFIFHASGLPVFCEDGTLRRLFSRLAYHNAQVALEVAQERITPHEVFHSRDWSWCPCAIEVPQRSDARGGGNHPFTSLFVGSLQEGKGVAEILKTAAILREKGHASDFRFRIVGKWFSTEYENTIRSMRSELGVEEMVELSGQLTGDAKWDAYFHADLFFFPTHYESEATPIVIMEALGSGLPVLSTEWAGIPAMLDGCETAKLLPVRSPGLYAEHLISLLESLENRRSIREKSISFYHDRFLPARFIERVNLAFHKAANIEEKSRPRPAVDGGAVAPPPVLADRFRESETGNAISLSVYLADQNPGYDRSFGISRMSHVVLNALGRHQGVRIDAIVSRTSQQPPAVSGRVKTLPWGTRRKFVRLLTDHFHPFFTRRDERPSVHYFPKGYLPLPDSLCSPSVVTIHDTIIQYDEDHYPRWRRPWEYAYWSLMLKHTLRRAHRIMTVSESSKRQIESFMERHGIPAKEIVVTYEPCLYEQEPQPESVEKDNYVIHLASCEPHKRTAHLIRWWSKAESRGTQMPMLHLIGTVPPEVLPLLEKSRSIAKRPFLADDTLRAAYLGARALILPSEIEGFGLPALEAYYLGTPVCFVTGTSVEEILSVATAKGAFNLNSPDSLFAALEQVMAMSAAEVRDCGLKLRETYAADRVAARMLRVFEEVAGCRRTRPTAGG